MSPSLVVENWFFGVWVLPYNMVRIIGIEWLMASYINSDGFVVKWTVVKKYLVRGTYLYGHSLRVGDQHLNNNYIADFFICVRPCRIFSDWYEVLAS